MKRVTAFTHLITGEGSRIAYTYSEIDDETGNLISQNNKGNFVVTNQVVLDSINTIIEFINTKQLK